MVEQVGVAVLVLEPARASLAQVQLGHSSIQVTMDRYGHLFPSAAEELAGRLDAVHRRTQTPETPGIGIA